MPYVHMRIASLRNRYCIPFNGSARELSVMYFEKSYENATVLCKKLPFKVGQFSGIPTEAIGVSTETWRMAYWSRLRFKTMTSDDKILEVSLE